MTPTAKPDHVALIQQEWARERPDLDVTPQGVIGRLHRVGLRLTDQLIDNVEVMKTSRPYPDPCTADIPYDYEGAVTPVNDVPTVVPAGAGVGKI